MALVLCPVCGNECAPDAVSCPKCGHPFVAAPPPVAAVVEQPTVVRSETVVRNVPKDRSFPNWVFLPIALVLVVLVFGILFLMRDNQADANQNVNVRIRETAASNTPNSRTASSSNIQTVNPPQTADSTVVVPPPAQQTGSTTVPGGVSTIPSSIPPSTVAGSQTVVTTATPNDKGNLEVKAAILNRTGASQPVKQEKFYLLTKDLESILSKAGIEPEAGDYASTFGAAIADPNRRELREKCLAAIKPYIVYSTLSDAQGKAIFKNVKPDSYYLFGVTKVGNSASVWNTGITVNPGENSIALNGNAASAAPSGLANTSY